MYESLQAFRSLDANGSAGDSFKLAIWQVVESNITILCVSLVASKPMVMVLLHESFISRLSNSLHKRLLPRNTTKSGGMQNLSSQIESKSVSNCPREESIELRKPSDALSGWDQALH